MLKDCLVVGLDCIISSRQEKWKTFPQYGIVKNKSNYDCLCYRLGKGYFCIFTAFVREYCLVLVSELVSMDKRNGQRKGRSEGRKEGRKENYV